MIKLADIFSRRRRVAKEPAFGRRSGWFIEKAGSLKSSDDYHLIDLEPYHCPICSAVIRAHRRYPSYVCDACARRACSKEGRRVEFTDDFWGSGLSAHYADTHEACDDFECWIDGIRCEVGEKLYGGVVIQVDRGKVI